MTAEVLELLQLHSGNWAAMGEDGKCCVYSRSPRRRRLTVFLFSSLLNTLCENATFFPQKKLAILNCITDRRLIVLSAMNHCAATRLSKLLCSLISCDNRQSDRLIAERFVCFFTINWINAVHPPILLFAAPIFGSQREHEQRQRSIWCIRNV